jgi:alpha-beta hydrolase superfamily lysophospholipase
MLLVASSRGVAGTVRPATPVEMRITDGQDPRHVLHGMWLHSTSWQAWADRFEAAGYDPVMPEWPGVADTVAATRESPDAQAGNGLDEIGEHLAQFAATLDSKPILIGHSVGGSSSRNCSAMTSAAPPSQSLQGKSKV